MKKRKVEESKLMMKKRTRKTIVASEEVNRWQNCLHCCDIVVVAGLAVDVAQIAAFDRIEPSNEA